MTIVHWFRHDLRISDNTALHEAYSRGDRLVPLFVWDESRWKRPDFSAKRADFRWRSLQALAQSLGALGHRLVVRRGDPAVEVGKVAVEAKASAVFANREYEPDAVKRDVRVAEALASAGVRFQSFKDGVIWEGRELLTGAGGVYTVFTPYSRAWKARPIPAPRPTLGHAKSPAPGGMKSFGPAEENPGLGPSPAAAAAPAIARPGERAARRQLDAFLKGPLEAYDRDRDFPALGGATSGLSPHLHAGTISVRTLIARLQAVGGRSDPPTMSKGANAWLGELIWREFYTQILANHPQVAEGSFRPEYASLAWEGTDAQFEAWCGGHTGFPIVDAAMRCLNETGWMHNRLRMIVAMFLVKDLLVSWQRGERYFMQRLVDGDRAANNGGWQWSAGTGTDAAPYFRIFNPATQGRRFDPDGEFVRRWVPELRDVAGDAIHEPWKNPLDAARGKYPQPIVDHARQRVRCLAMFQKARKA